MKKKDLSFLICSIKLKNRTSFFSEKIYFLNMRSRIHNRKYPTYEISACELLHNLINKMFVPLLIPIFLTEYFSTS